MYYLFVIILSSLLVGKSSDLVGVYGKFYNDECLEIFDRSLAKNRGAKSTMIERIRKAIKVIAKGRL